LKSLKCKLHAWNLVHKEEIFPTDSSFYKQFSSIQIPAIHRIARKLYPNGIDCPKKEAIELSLKQTLYHPVLQLGSLQTDIDIVVPTGENSVEIVECKAYANNKPEIFQEMGFHLYVLEKMNIKVEKATVLLINPDFLYENEIEPIKYFQIKDVTTRAKSIQQQIHFQINELTQILKSEIPPERKEDYCCYKPNDCKTISVCWPELEDANIFSLREAGKLTHSLYEKNIRYLKDIPDEIELSKSQTIQKNADVNSKPYIEKDNIKSFLEKVKYPLYFLDFETVNPALPIYAHTKPFQHIPFLFYLFIKENPNSELKEVYYIESEGNDPRKKILEILKESIQPGGTIICYNDLIEKKCIAESAALYPEYLDWKDSIFSDFLDISTPFRLFYYYNPSQKGTASLKSVLPALTGIDYKDLTICDGNTANLEYLRIQYKPKWVEDKEKVLADLVQYCRMDSWAMVKILESLENLIKEEDFLLEENSL
jgi:hypothetical protein